MSSKHLLLLGNGFDLYFKLPTRYDCFLHVLEFLCHYDIDSINNVYDILGNEELIKKNRFISNNCHIYKAAYTNIVLDKNQLYAVQNECKNSKLFSFLLKSFNNETGWIDFEKEIEKILIAFLEFFSKTTTRNFTFCNISKSSQFIIKEFDFLETSGVVRERSGFREYSVKPEYCHFYPYGSGNLEICREAIVKKLVDELNTLTSLIRKYLTLFVDNSIQEIKHQGLFPDNCIFSDNDYIFSLNYTSTFEQIYGYSLQLSHIHGSLNDNIVLGINSNEYDELPDLNTLFIEFKKYYQRVLYNTDYAYLETLSKIRDDLHDDDKITLYIFGHSLDSTDKDIIIELFDIATDIRIYYHERYIVGNYIKNLISIYGKETFDLLRKEKHLKFIDQKSGDLI